MIQLNAIKKGFGVLPLIALLFSGCGGDSQTRGSEGPSAQTAVPGASVTDLAPTGVFEPDPAILAGIQEIAGKLAEELAKNLGFNPLIVYYKDSGTSGDVIQIYGLTLEGLGIQVNGVAVDRITEGNKAKYFADFEMPDFDDQGNPEEKLPLEIQFLKGETPLWVDYLTQGTDGKLAVEDNKTGIPFTYEIPAIPPDPIAVSSFPAWASCDTDVTIEGTGFTDLSVQVGRLVEGQIVDAVPFARTELLSWDKRVQFSFDEDTEGNVCPDLAFLAGTPAGETLPIGAQLIQPDGTPASVKVYKLNEDGTPTTEFEYLTYLPMEFLVPYPVVVPGPSVTVTKYTNIAGAGDTVTILGKHLRDLSVVIATRDRVMDLEQADPGQNFPDVEIDLPIEGNTETPPTQIRYVQEVERIEPLLHGRVIQFVMPNLDELVQGVAYFDLVIVFFNKEGEQVDMDCNEVVQCSSKEASTSKTLSITYSVPIREVIQDLIDLYGLLDLATGDLIPGVPMLGLPDLTDLLNKAIERIRQIDSESISLDEAKEIAKSLAESLGLYNLPEIEGPSFDLPDLESLLQKAIQRITEIDQESITIEEAKDLANALANTLGLKDLPTFDPLTPQEVAGELADQFTDILREAGWLPIVTGLDDATAVAVDPATGNVWVSVSTGVTGYQDLLRIENNGAKTTFVLSLHFVDNLDFDKEGNLLISAGNCIKKASVAEDDDLTISDVICLSDDGSVNGIGVTSSNEIIVAATRKEIYGIDSDGVIRTVVEDLSLTPMDLTVDPTGRIFFTSDGASTLMEALPDGSVQTVWEGDDIHTPTAVGLHWDGSLLVNDDVGTDYDNIIKTDGTVWMEGLDRVDMGGISSDPTGKYVAVLDRGAGSVYLRSAP